MVSQWHMQTSAALALSKRLQFTPERYDKDDPKHCAQYRQARDAMVAATHQRGEEAKRNFRWPSFGKASIASCTDERAGAVYPCPEGGQLELLPNKYCRDLDPAQLLNATEAEWMKQCSRISAPILIPYLMEWIGHPDNINHIGRDLIYTAAMANLGKKNGYTVMLPPLRTFDKMIPWGKNIIQALARRDLVRLGNWPDEAQRFAKVSLRLAANGPVLRGKESQVSGRDVDDASCGIVCATTATHLGVAYVQPDDAVLLQQAVLEYCGIPLEPPADRTLLLITRKPGGKRALANLKRVNETLLTFAESYGLEYATVNFGEHSFCQQVNISSQAYIMVGIQGADPINTIFQHKDAALIEMFGRK